MAGSASDPLLCVLTAHLGPTDTFKVIKKSFSRKSELLPRDWPIPYLQYQVKFIPGSLGYGEPGQPVLVIKGIEPDT